MNAPFGSRFRAVARVLLCFAAFAASDATATNPVLEETGLAPAEEESATAAPAEETGPEASPAAAEMLKSMREKGLLTEDEYEDLYRRQAMFEAKQTMKEGIPGWMKDWTFGGDVRFRYERRDYGNLGFDQTYELGKQNIDVVSNPPRGLGTENRARVRLRLGAEKKVVPELTFGFRIATSNETAYGTSFSTLTGQNYTTALLSDPRSPNVTFGDFFSYKSIFLDRAYLTYEPGWAPALAIQVGKFANPFVSKRMATDYLIWDNDISPEGVNAKYRFDFVDNELWFEGVGAFLTVQERSAVTLAFNSTTQTAVSVLPDIDEQNPFMMAFQGALHGRPDDWIQMGGRVSYYDLSHIGTKLAAAMEDLGNGGESIEDNPLFRLLSPTNPYFEDGRSQGRMKELVVDGYMTFTPWGDRYAITPYFQYMTMLNSDSENDGWMAGMEFGSPELVRLTVMYAQIGRNATMALFTDSDTFDGLTNVKGWVVAAERELWRGVRVRGAYMVSRQLEAECELADVNLALCDTASQISNLAPFRMTTLDRQRFQLDLQVDF